MAITNTIYIGSLTEPLYSFNNDRIRSISTEQSVALVGQELSIDTLSFTVSDTISNVKDILIFRSSDGQEIMLEDGEIYAIDVPNNYHVSDLILLPSGTPVWYYQNDDLVGKFYLENVLRTGSNVYDINCVSTIGILEKLETGGGLYQATTFGEVLGKILAKNLDGTGDPVIEYAIDDEVAELQVSGWIPHGSKRDALYQLIFAFGVNIVKNPDGRPRFTFVTSNRTVILGGVSDFIYDYSGEIADDDIFDVGNIEYTPSYSSVTVLEHTYTHLLNGNTTVLYDNSGSATGPMMQIWFDNAPIMVSTLTTEGGIYIESANENGAVVSGIGKISGVPYTHATRAVSMENVGGDIEKTITVNDATMVSEINSDNLLKRLFAFYCPDKYIEKISNDVVYGDQRVGKKYRFNNPYKEKAKAFLSKMTINASSFNRATCEYYADYDPAGQAGLYQYCQILTKDSGGLWYPPAEALYGKVTQVRMVLIGGGTGGGSGWPGENGEAPGVGVTIGASDNYSDNQWYGGKGGKGGAGGAGGSPGRVKVITLNNIDQNRLLPYTIGLGGDGGARTGFIPDSKGDLYKALYGAVREEDLDAYYAEELSRTDWAGSPNPGSAGTATVFYEWDEENQEYITHSTDDEDAYVPEGGVYNPLWDEYYALPGNPGVKGGDGGAMQVGTEENFAWETDGESVSFSGTRYAGVEYDHEGIDTVVLRKFEQFSESYQGGLTGQTKQNTQLLPDLSECPCIAYGGSGAGAAVGLSREVNPHMDGQSNADGMWQVLQDEGGGG